MNTAQIVAIIIVAFMAAFGLVGCLILFARVERLERILNSHGIYE